MIIDVHTHITKLPDSPYSKSYEENLNKLLGEARSGDIDYLFIIAGFEKKDGFNISTKSLISLVEKESKIRVIGSIDVLSYTKRDLEALEDFLKKKLIIGIKLYTGYQHFYPNDRRCLPIYALCIKYKIPVVFHSGDTLAGYIKDPKVKYSHPLHIDEIAADFPNLKIVIAHMGNPWLIDCAEILYKNPNVYADISGLIVGENLDTPYGKLMRQRIIELIDYVGDNKLLYGTDWPLCPMKTYMRFVENLGLSEERLEQLLYKNAGKVFNLGT